MGQMHTLLLEKSLYTIPNLRVMPIYPKIALHGCDFVEETRVGIEKP